MNYRLKKAGVSIYFTTPISVSGITVPTFQRFAAKMFTYGEGMAVICRKNHAIVRWYACFVSFVLLAFIGGSIVSLVYRQFALLLFILAIYFICLILVTLKVAKKIKSISVLWCLIILPAQHVFYALGFIKGLFDMVGIRNCLRKILFCI